MEFRYPNIKLNLNDDVQAYKFLANRPMGKNAQEICNMFLEHGYKLDGISGEAVKLFTLDEKEVYEISEILNEIDELGKKNGLDLKDIFNANLRPACFKRSFLERVKYCLNNKIPFLNSDNTFVDILIKDELYTADVNLEVNNNVNNEIVNENKTLDEEDLSIKTSIIKTLGEINEKSSDSTLTFIISSIIANLDEAILNSNKAYRVQGVTRIVEDAIKGVALTPEMQYLVDNEILAGFMIDNVERGM